MKRTASLIVCTALLLSMTPAFRRPDTALAAARAVITAPAVLMRIEPNAGAVVQRILHTGAQVDVLSEINGFLWVSQNGAAGFIPASSIEPEKKTADASGILRGHSGLLVTWLQNALRQMGYYEGDPTGFYGLNTYRSVKAFQKSGGLREDGMAGSATQEALIALTQSASSTVSAASYNTASDDTPYGALSWYGYMETGSSGEGVRRLQQALYDKGYFAHEPTGVYGEATADAVKAFQKSTGLWEDGVAGEQTQALIFSGADAAIASFVQPLVAGALKPIAKSSEKRNGVWVLNWDDGDVERVFPRRTYATVIDVRTGKRYQVRRFQGTNHADVEMVTREDTETFVSLLEDEWSWAARPIYLEIDGELYAAAINGMPHGDITLLENGVGGHFCVHFVGSTTHVSGESNERMQAAIEEAIKLAPKFAK